MEAAPDTTPTQTNLPHNTISGLSGEQADEFVELAYANNRLANKLDSPDWTEAFDAKYEIAGNDERLKRLSNIAMGKPEYAQPTPVEQTRRVPKPQIKSMLVVNPRDGRIVPYGQMTHGKHPQGGMIVRR